MIDRAAVLADFRRFRSMGWSPALALKVAKGAAVERAAAAAAISPYEARLRAAV